MASSSPSRRSSAENKRNKDDEDDDDADDEVALSQLLSSLAAGARSVQGLPIGDDFAYTSSFPEFQTPLSNSQAALYETIQMILTAVRDHDDDEEEEDDDDYDGNKKNDELLQRTLLPHTSVNLDDPVLWEKCADVCESLAEQVESFLNGINNNNNNTAATATTSLLESSLHQWSAQARQKSQSAFGRMLQNTQHDLPKPQVVYKMTTPHCQKFASAEASRVQPFVPAAHPEKPFGVIPLDLTLQPGSGLDNNNSSKSLLQQQQQQQNSMITPTHHVPHVYKTEIETLQYRDWQLNAVKPVSAIPIVTPLTATWIDSVPALQQLAERLSDSSQKKKEEVRCVVAIDLEAHSYRSFAGLVCLMQISLYRNRDDEDCNRMENYLIDTLVLQAHINQYLAPMFANPDIVKVMHGADSDIAWLQRDFGIYVVNLFDTGRASRALKLSSAGYAHVLSKYVGIQADKSHQLADWRQRPLPDDMQQYAIQDTHYLLDIYERMKWDLEQNAETSVVQVLEDSKRVSLFQYLGEFFKPDGYKSIMLSSSSSSSSSSSKRRGKGTRRRHQTELNATQEAVLKTLWDWRDLTARAHDESLFYVCTNANLLRMALAVPTTTTTLQALFNPIPPLVLECAQEILDRIKQAVAQVAESQRDQQDEEADDNEEEEEEELDDDEDEEVARQQLPVGTRSSAFFKPAEKESSLRDSIMSPVLGTEALYKQAGWMTPLGAQLSSSLEAAEELATGTTSTGTEDDEITDPSEKPKRLLSIHASNQDYRSKQYSEHSMEFGKDGNRGRSVDGMGTVRAARESSLSPITTSIDEDARQAKQNAAALQSGLLQKDSIPSVLGMISPTTDVDEEEGPDSADPEPKDKETTGDDTDEEFAIPRSMREIYRISNRNRRNKKAGSPTPERGVTPTSEKEREELRKAEALLHERGQEAASYFEGSGDGSPGKRPRTRSRTGRESEESVPAEPSNVATPEDDLAFMQEIGWIKSKEEGQKLMRERYGKGKASAPGGDVSDNQRKEINRHATNYGGGFDYSGSVGVMPATQSSNPFFAGAALTGGPLAQGFSGKPVSKKSGKGRQQNRRQQERPEKKDGRTHAYRKR